jgi:hypothetical protein
LLRVFTGVSLILATSFKTMVCVDYGYCISNNCTYVMKNIRGIGTCI